MGMPSGAGARLEGDGRATNPCRRVSLEWSIDPDGTSEIVSRSVLLRMPGSRFA